MNRAFSFLPDLNALSFRHSAIKKRAALSTGLLLSLFLFGCDSTEQAAEQLENTETSYADTVYVNGAFYTLNENEPWASAVAITDGKFVFVGDTANVEAYVGASTQRIDLEGQMALPGLVESHIHPLLATIQQEFEFFVPPFLTGDAFDQALKAYADKTEDLWIQGGIWNLDMFPAAGPNKSTLDRIIHDRPVALWDLSHHHLWVNSKALELVGIDKNSPEIPNGEIVRDSQGEPTGWLKEAAAVSVASNIPAHGPERYEQSLVIMNQHLNSLGITTVTDAWVFEKDLDAYQAFDQAGRLSLQVAAAAVFSAETARPSQADTETKSFSQGNFRSDLVKLALDGVPFSHTSAMLKPYADRPDIKGKVHFEQSELNQLVTDFDRQGLRVKMHATGDAAVRAALDAIEAARKANGDSGLQHQVAHSEFVDPEDIPRYVELNAVAEVSPAIWHADPIHETGITKAVGAERSEAQWPIRSLLESGALVIAGSDWPAAVPTPNPWPAIEALITRQHPYNLIPGSLNAPQAIDLASALKLYTINGMRALGDADIAGSLEVGKDATLVVIDQNLFEIPAEQISETEVLMTLFKGELVYEATAE